MKAIFVEIKGYG